MMMMMMMMMIMIMMMIVLITIIILFHQLVPVTVPPAVQQAVGGDAGRGVRKYKQLLFQFFVSSVNQIIAF